MGFRHFKGILSGLERKNRNVGVSFNVLNLWTVAGAPRAPFLKKSLGLRPYVRILCPWVSLGRRHCLEWASPRQLCDRSPHARGSAGRHDVTYHVMFACVIQGRVIRSIETRVYIYLIFTNLCTCLC